MKTKTPPFLISASLLLWGWQTRLLLAAIAMAIVLEGARLLKVRWEFTEADIRHVADLCTILLAMAVVLAVNKAAGRFLILTIQWLPLAVFPLMVIQQASRAGTIQASALLFMFRRKRARETRRQLRIDISYPFYGLCIISAAGANNHRAVFYCGLIALVVWGLWPMRARRYPFYIWFSLLLAAGAAGYVGQLGLMGLQSQITQMVLRYYLKESTNPFKSTTAIGDVGALKTSDRILFRVTGDGTSPMRPLLLRQACYTAYSASNWYATHSGFDEDIAQTGTGAWKIAAGGNDLAALKIAIDLPKGKNLLALPGGTFKLERLDVDRLQRNTLGALRTINEGGLRLFQADYDPTRSLNRPPEEGDLKIPREEAPAVEKIAREIGLHPRSATEALSTIHAFFTSQFGYSLVLRENRSGKTGLADFLLRSRTGHCEYFATATVLLLRAAGIPARYVTGYAATEYSSLEDMLVVRQKHAHAWALAWVSGKWVDVDNTPADWVAIESSRSSVLVRVADLLSFLWFRLSRWRQGFRMEELTRYLVLPLLVLMIFFVKRVAGRKRASRVVVAAPGQKTMTDRIDREEGLYALEKWLNRQGYHRPPGETLQRWCEHVSGAAPEILSVHALRPIVRLHYLKRFGAAGLGTDAQRQLDSGVRAIIERLPPGQK